MVNRKGLASYCQDCGLCTLDTQKEPTAINKNLVEIIVDEVVRSLRGKVPDGTSESGRPLIPLGVSNHHVHLTEATFKMLFGPKAELEKYRDLYQPGEIAAKQTVTVVGPKMRALQNVRILGPLRDYDQVELTLSDAIALGISPPIRNSGDLKGAAPLTIVGPESSVFIKECGIVANRHLHLPGDTAIQLDVKDKDFCKMRIGGAKGIIFENVLVRVNDAWRPQIHLDTDDANAANVRCDMLVEFYGKM